MLILPRQARDKHRKNSIKCRFLAVLPEFMVLRIGDKVAAERALKNGGSTSDAHVGATSDKSTSKSWTNLTDKLRALIHMKVRKHIFCAILY